MDDPKTHIQTKSPAITTTPTGLATPQAPRSTPDENSIKPSSALGTASLIVGLMSLGCYGLAFLLLRSSADKGRPLVEVLPGVALLIILGMCLPLLGVVLGFLSVGDRGPVPKSAVAGCFINCLLIFAVLFLVLVAKASRPLNNYQPPGRPPPPNEVPF